MLWIKSQTIEINPIPQGYEIEIRTPFPSFNKLEKDSIPYFPNAGYLFQKGFPELQKLAVMLQTYSDLGFEIEILQDSSVEISASIAPSAGFIYQNQSEIIREKGVVYQINQYFPSSIYQLFDVADIGKEKKQSIWFHVLQYNPVIQKLKIHTYMKIRVLEVQAKQKKLSFDDDVIELKRSKLLILTSTLFNESLLPFIQWKRQMGLDVLVHTFISNPTTLEVKSLVSNYYSTNQIDFLIIVGDHHIIPAGTSIHGPGDYVYGLLNGNDTYIDIGIGRFPADTPHELSIMLNKSMSNEKALYSGSWMQTCGGIASAEGGPSIGDKGETDFQHISGINTIFAQKGFESILIAEKKAYPMSVSQLFNQGAAYVFYAGHGEENLMRSVWFNNDSVKALTNKNAYPVIIDAACLNGNFTYNDCIAEEFLKAEDNNSPTGASAMLASTISQLWAPPMLGQDIFTELLFDASKKLRLAEICNEMYYGIISQYGIGGAETAFTWALFGDPTSYLWNKIPQKQHLDIPNKIDVSKDTFTIVVPRGSFVTILADTLLLDFKYALSDTVKLFTGVNPQMDSALITVWRDGYAPFTQTLFPFSDAGSYYGISSLRLTDDNNSITENEEWINAWLTVKNYGSIVGKNITLTAKDCDNRLYIENSILFCDSIAGLESIEMGPFRLRTQSLVENDEKVRVCFSITDASEQQNSASFSFPIFTPVLSFSNPVINQQWNVSTFIADSSRVQVSVIVKNKGKAPAYDVRANIDVPDVFVSCFSTNQSIPILPMSEDTFTFTILLDNNIYQGHLIIGSININNAQLPFSFYYKKRESVISGTQSFIASGYPFYNYYKINRSQMLYSDTTIVGNPMVIDSIGFEIARASANIYSRNLKDFSIRIKETEATTINLNFEDMTDASLVFSQSSYSLPANKAWVYFRINRFNYSGKKPILIEIQWGANSFTASYNDAFELYATKTVENRVVYGFSDFKTDVPVSGTSNLLPNIIFAGSEVQLHQVTILVNKSLFEADTSLLQVKIGQKTYPVSIHDTLHVQIPAGVYHYSLSNSYSEFFLNDSFQVYKDDIILLGSKSNASQIGFNDSHFEKHKLNAYVNSSNLVIINPNQSRINAIEVFSIEGKAIYRIDIHSSKAQIEIPIPLTHGVFLIRISTDVLPGYASFIVYSGM